MDRHSRKTQRAKSVLRLKPRNRTTFSKELDQICFYAQRAEGPSLQNRRIHLGMLPLPPSLDSGVERAGMRVYG